ELRRVHRPIDESSPPLVDRDIIGAPCGSDGRVVEPGNQLRLLARGAEHATGHAVRRAVWTLRVVIGRTIRFGVRIDLMRPSLLRVVSRRQRRGLEPKEYDTGYRCLLRRTRQRGAHPFRGGPAASATGSAQ